MTKAKDTTFAAVLAVLATAVIGEELWAWGDGLPLWIWLTSFVCALLALVGAGVKIVSNVVGRP
jgi:hypothetical protein